MPTLPTVILSELVHRSRIPRVPEPDVVMDDAEHVAGYTRAGREVDVMAPTHLFHTAQACELIRPGDRVLDLGCGPGTQLVQLAALHPRAKFVGMDLSDAMLDEARAYARIQGVGNVSFERDDMTRIERVADASVDVVLSSMTLHHLPRHMMLSACFAAIRRVLKPGGGLYLADFLRLRHEQSMHFFAYQHADRQPPSFTEDYFNSLRAAFSVEQYRAAMVRLPPDARLHRTWPLPIFMAIRTPPRSKPDAQVIARLNALVMEMSEAAQRDFKAIRFLFRRSGLRGPAITTRRPRRHPALLPALKRLVGTGDDPQQSPAPVEPPLDAHLRGHDAH